NFLDPYKLLILLRRSKMVNPISEGGGISPYIVPTKTSIKEHPFTPTFYEWAAKNGNWMFPWDIVGSGTPATIYKVPDGFIFYVYGIWLSPIATGTAGDAIMHVDNNYMMVASKPPAGIIQMKFPIPISLQGGHNLIAQISGTSWQVYAGCHGILVEMK
ncbi:unnamed protein product, partial [marine sediment metagenome]